MTEVTSCSLATGEAVSSSSNKVHIRNIFRLFHGIHHSQVGWNKPGADTREFISPPAVRLAAIRHSPNHYHTGLITLHTYRCMIPLISRDSPSKSATLQVRSSIQLSLPKLCLRLNEFHPRSRLGSISGNIGMLLPLIECLERDSEHQGQPPNTTPLRLTL